MDCERRKSFCHCHLLADKKIYKCTPPPTRFSIHQWRERFGRARSPNPSPLSHCSCVTLFFSLVHLIFTGYCFRYRLRRGQINFDPASGKSDRRAWCSRKFALRPFWQQRACELRDGRASGFFYSVAIM